MSLYRALSPFPNYLASAWVDSKSVLLDKNFQQVSDGVAQRATVLLRGIPVRDHSSLLKELRPEQAQEVRDAVDEFVRIAPVLSLLCVVWRRSFYDARERLVA
jgi:hypothetical protein